jgi:hypothetical protein
MNLYGISRPLAPAPAEADMGLFQRRSATEFPSDIHISSYLVLIERLNGRSP